MKSNLLLYLPASNLPVRSVKGNPFCLAVGFEDGIIFLGCRIPVKMIGNPVIFA